MNNNHTHLKRYICIDLEMTEFTSQQRHFIPGANGEIIQFGAVMLDEKFNMISKFSSFVKPRYTSITPVIQDLTGITDELLNSADDFLTVFDKFAYWRGEGDITTFCWSKADHNQLWYELNAKGNNRDDLFQVLNNFVDLQQFFGKLVSSKTMVSLESAMRLLQMNYEGQVHSAYSDSFNTARILHKLMCSETIVRDFDYIAIKNPKKSKNKIEKINYNSSFASFMPQELLVQFGYLKESKDETKKSEIYVMDEDINLLKESPLYHLVDKNEIKNLCLKYKIVFKNWLKLAVEVFTIEEMLVA